MSYEISIGSPYPYGATWDGEGVNFALFSENATAVDLCLFGDKENSQEETRINVTERTHQVWHVYVHGLTPGQLYGYRVHGPYDPKSGHRFNDHKLLLDPYAKAIAGTIKADPSLHGYILNSEEKDLSYNEVDSAPCMPKCVVTDPAFDWGQDKCPKIPYFKSIIYEAHVKGFTMMHPDIPEELRGTYAGLAHPVAIDYLKKLGITAIELMPVQHFVTDNYLLEKGLQNYWGYNTIGFFAPDPRYSSADNRGGQVTEFKQMVKELHKAGIEVILDVVYNHTAEGNQMGPTLSFRGIDNSSYYRLSDEKNYYMDYTGTGNTLNAQLPGVLQLIMDSLRYWIQEMHIDGFRFDLASTLARELHDVQRLSSFFDIIHQDPIISQVKLIAEPWDIGEGGYQVGNFPPGWAEWNGKYRDCMRDYWRGAESVLAEFAERFTGSSDLYKNDYRMPTASVNFITAHDGFTLHDLVSYNGKHNEANKEDNKDGADDNRSWNCGAEGPNEDLEINKLRERQKRNLLTSLFLSQGIPMLVAGDELGKTQNGNNNAYCQDDELSWINWNTADQALIDFTRNLINIRNQHPVFRRRGWFKGRPIRSTGLGDICWHLPDGTEMRDEHWNTFFAKSLGIFLNGKGIHTAGYKGDEVTDDSFYVIFNAHSEPIEFTIPSGLSGKDWVALLDTAQYPTEEKKYQAGQKLNVDRFSIVLLQQHIDSSK